MTQLSNKTVIISGASRGIGFAIAKRCATAGANIVILAKDMLSENHENNPTHIEQAMLTAGGQGLVIDCDLCDEQQIKYAVEKALNKFGQIDALINNTSAFCFTDTLHTSAQQFDTLMSTNIRATFLLSQACIPTLKHAENPHIINIAPPLHLDGRWFQNHLAFSLSKYGMSLCTLGMATEFADAGIAINSLWPQTTIATSTIEEHFLPEIYAGSRWPNIMADAAYALLCSAKQYSGQFLIDEDILRTAGITDFSHYAVDPNAPLIQDLFTADEYTDLREHMKPLARESFKINAHDDV